MMFIQQHPEACDFLQTLPWLPLYLILFVSFTTVPSVAFTYQENVSPLPPPPSQQRETKHPQQQSALSPHRTLARLRIPSAWLLQALRENFQLQAPVDRTILGTRSQGQATCWGRISGRLLPAENSAKLLVTISGTLTSQTRGVNGPALIDSTSVTSYRADSLITFAGQRFVAGPVQVCGSTQLSVTGVHSRLPRLRGRVVRNVAARRVQQSHAQAEAITQQLTLNDLQQRMNVQLEQRICELNSRVEKQLEVLQLLHDADATLILSTSPHLLQIDVTSTNVKENQPALPQVAEIGNGVELWLPVPPLAKTVVGATALATLPEILGNLLKDRPKLEELLTEQLHFSRHGQWLIILLEAS